MSPDTDCYHIGMPLNPGLPKDVIMQVNKYTSKEIKFLHLPALFETIEKDPDLSSIPNILLPQIFCALFIVTGCDYTSLLVELARPLSTAIYSYMQNLLIAEDYLAH